MLESQFAGSQRKLRNSLITIKLDFLLADLYLITNKIHFICKNLHSHVNYYSKLLTYSKVPLV
jgi:hypothetical protein